MKFLLNLIKNKFRVILLAFVLLLGLNTGTALASNHNESLFSGAKDEACAGAELKKNTNGSDCTVDDQETLNTTIQNGIDLISIIVGIISVVVLIIGGIKFVTSEGDSAKVTSARNTILYAIVGLILVAFAQIIVKFVITEFS